MIRGLAASTTATFVAALFHEAGGGAAPSWAVVAFGLALASLAAIALAGSRASLWRLTAAVGDQPAAVPRAVHGGGRRVGRGRRGGSARGHGRARRAAVRPAGHGRRGRRRGDRARRRHARLARRGPRR
ncbi:hypothetical protein [Clavibacter zhangzhiyongii]|uniref:hypothetical protein n=1 Tax=Clavibacter zhangzhiyongii TaxID=2768071 RepID=UPI0039E10A13